MHSLGLIPVRLCLQTRAGTDTRYQTQTDKDAQSPTVRRVAGQIHNEVWGLKGKGGTPPRVSKAVPRGGGGGGPKVSGGVPKTWGRVRSEDPQILAVGRANRAAELQARGQGGHGGGGRPRPALPGRA